VPHQASIVLDVDRLILNPDNDPLPKAIYYEQICMVELYGTQKESVYRRTGPVEIKYYLYEEQTGALNLSRLRSIVLPKTQDNFGLYDEIQQRSSGPAPDWQARIALTIWQLVHIALWLLAIPLYFLAVGIVAAILT
jgi:hypothetical protein